jgi:hypothetical protein
LQVSITDTGPSEPMVGIFRDEVKYRNSYMPSVCTSSILWVCIHTCVYLHVE